MVVKAPLDDPTIYPVEEKVGEDLLQCLIVELLRPLIERWLRERGIVALVGADQFIYYRQYDSTSRYAPDVYVIPGLPYETPVSVWKRWEGAAPSFALEVCSRDWRKDYETTPERCEAIGIGELVVFDPWWGERPGSMGARWQVWRASKQGLRRVTRSDEDRIRSKALGCWLRSVGYVQATRIRLGTGPGGDTLFPTAAEAAEAERQALQAKVAELEAQLRRRGR